MRSIQYMETLQNLYAGDFVEGGVDEIAQNLKEENPEKEIDYENIYTDANGYMAEITVEGIPVAVVESLTGSPMVKKVHSNNVEKVANGEIRYLVYSDFRKTVEAGSESEAVEKAHDELTEAGISSEDLRVTNRDEP